MIQENDKLYFDGEKRPYRVRTADSRYIIATKPFNLQQTYLYTVIDRKHQERGPCDLIFGFSFEEELTDPVGAQKALDMFNSGEVSLSRRRSKDLTESEIDQINKLDESGVAA